jgi:hypothetical protein
MTRRLARGAGRRRTPEEVAGMARFSAPRAPVTLRLARGGRPHLVDLRSELLADQARGRGFQVVDEAAEFKVGRQRHAQVNVIRLAVHLDQLPAPPLTPGY